MAKPKGRGRLKARPAKGRTAKTPAKSPSRSAKSPGRPAKSPGRSAKSPSRTSKSPGRPAKSHSKPAKSHGRPAKSPGRPATSPGRTAKSSGRAARSPNKSPGRAAKSPTKSPGRVARTSTKSPGRAAKSPTKSPGRAARTSTKSPGRAAKSPTKSPGRAARSPTKSPGRAARSPTKSPGRAARSPTKSPGRAARSPTKSPGRATKSPTKSPGRATKSPAKSLGRATKSPAKSLGRAARSLAKLPGRAGAKSTARSAKSPGRQGKSPARVKSPQRSPARSARSPAKSPASSPRKPAPKSLAKSPTRPSRKSAGKSAAKSPAKSLARSPAKSARSPARARLSPKKLSISPAKVSKESSARVISSKKKSVAEPAKRTRGKPKKMTRPTTKARARVSPAKASPPKKMVSTKVSRKASPAKKVVSTKVSRKASPAKNVVSTRVSQKASTAKNVVSIRVSRKASPAKNVVSTRVSQKATPAKNVVSTRVSGKASPSKKVVSTKVSPKSNSRGRPKRETQVKASATPVKKSQNKVPVVRSQSPRTNEIPTRGSPRKAPVSPKKIQTPSPAKKSVPTSHVSPRKRSAVASSPPTPSPKKAKTTSEGQTSKGPKAKPQEVLTLPPRPTRKIVLPAKLRDAAPETPAWSRSPSKAAAKPAPTGQNSASRPSRSDIVSRRDVAKAKESKTAKGKESPKPKSKGSPKPKAKESPKLKSKDSPKPKPKGRDSSRSNERTTAKDTSKLEETAPAQSVRSGSSPRASTRVAANKKEAEQSTPAANTPVAKTLAKPVLKPYTPGAEKRQGASQKRVTIVVPARPGSTDQGSPSSPGHPCKHCGVTFRSHSDVEVHENQCNKNQSRTDKRYKCNKCSGTFTMSDLILHKKQAHPQRDENLSLEVQENDAQWEQVKAIPKGPEPEQNPKLTAGGGLVFKVPTGGNLNEVIRQAVQAAASAGLVPANKKIVVSGPQMKANVTADTIEKRKQSAPTASSPPAAKKVKVLYPPAKDKGPMITHVGTPPRTSASSPPSQAKKSSAADKSAAVSTPPRTVTFGLSPTKVFTCLDCGDTFPSRKHVSDHKSKCPGVGKTSVHACMDCNKTYTSRLLLNAHKREVHFSTSSKPKGSGVTIRSFKCSECELFFPVESEVKKHVQEIHGGVGKGTMCNVVATPEDLRSGNWNRNVSSEMVEEVIQNIISGVTRKDAEPASPGILKPSTSQTPASPPRPAPTTPQVSSPVRSASASPARSPGLVEPGPNRTPGQCLDCFMKVSSRLELAQHKRQCQKAIDNRQLFCFDCSSSFKTYFELSRHKHEMHLGEARVLKCLPCDALFKTHAAWLEHCKTHKKSPDELNKPPPKDKSPTKGKGKSPEKSKEKLPVFAKKVPPAKTSNTQAKSQEPPVKVIRMATIQSREPQAKVVRTEKKQGPPGKVVRIVQIPSASKEAIKAKESEAVSGVQRTRSGRVVQKKQDDDVIVEKVVKGTRNRAANSQPIPAPGHAPKTIGTIEFVDNVPVESPQKSSESPRRRSPRAAKSEEDAAETKSSPRKRGQTDTQSQGPKSKKSTQSSELEASTSQEQDANISLANGLVTIAADKANDYQIFVDAKQDGSSIQVKLVRNEDLPKQTPPRKTVEAATSPQKPKSRISAPSSEKESYRAVLQKVPAEKKAAKEAELEAKKAGSTKSYRAALTTSNEPSTSAKPGPTNVGKVVQKGKPFVIGGQTLVPIQFPPDFELPGGATGGQKVFAIPSTNLPPQLLQLLAKQNKGMNVPQQPTKEKVAVSAQAAKSSGPKTPPAKKKPSILRQSPPKSPPKSSEPVQEVSLKGMTGAQLMARAQARILGRPLPALKIDGPVPPFKNIKDSPSKSAAGKGTGAKGATQQSQKGMKIVSPGLKSHEGHSKASPYHDPLFVYQCTSCERNFKSTAEINKHMKTCPEAVGAPAKKQRTTDVWHIKPVAGGSARSKDTSGDGVEWYVASKDT